MSSRVAAARPRGLAPVQAAYRPQSIVGLGAAHTPKRRTFGVLRRARAPRSCERGGTLPHNYALQQHYPILEELRSRFAMPTPRVFVFKASSPNASSFGVREPYLILFASALISALTPEEFKFLLGREMGHIKLGHTRLAPLLGGGHLSSGRVAAWLEKIRNLITASYQRAQELSCDRIGVLATRNVRPAVDLAIKQGIPPPRGAQIGISGEQSHGRRARGTGGLSGCAC
jgi:hypothetical protein